MIVHISLSVHFAVNQNTDDENTQSNPGTNGR